MNDQSSKTLESMSQAAWYNRWTKDKFSKYLSGEILEVGCGIGNFSSELVRYGQLTCIDINQKYLQEAKNKLGNQAKIGFGDIELGKYFFKAKIFDTIVCLNVLEHIENDQQALSNMNKLLDTKGTLILLVPFHKILFNSIDRSIGHYRRYGKASLIELLDKSNFKITKTRNLNLLGGVGWFIAGRLFKDKSVSEGKIKIFNWMAPLFLFLENIMEPPFGTSILVIAKKKR